VLGIAVADVDGDGNLDLVSAGQDVEVFYQGPAAVFKRGATLGLTSSSVQVADIDRDGDADMVVTSGGGIAILVQSSPGTFEIASPIADKGRAVAVLAADLDGDGDVDIAAANDQMGTATVFWGGR
jgi:hypothetical protein